MDTRKSLLIVDEDRLLGDLVKYSMENEQLHVRIADSVSRAQEEVASSEPDLILVNPAITEGNRLLDEWCQRLGKSKLFAIVDSDLTRRMARRAGLGLIDKKDGLSDMIHLLRTRLDLKSLPLRSDRHILVVDDEEEIREMLSGFLSGNGYSVSTASDGQEALEMIDRDPSVSVVLLDINMPRLGGISTLVEIHKRGSPPDVIMITVISDQEIAHRAIELGAFDYILKPLDLQRVESTISACLSHRQYANKGWWKRLLGG